MANRHVTTVSSEPRAQVSNTVRVSPAFVFLGRCCRGTPGCCNFIFPWCCSVLFFQVGFIPLHEYNRLQAGLQAAGDQPHIVFATVAARKRLAGARSHAPVRVIVNLPCPPLLEGAVRAAIGRRIDTGNNTTGPPAVATTRARAPPTEPPSSPSTVYRRGPALQRRLRQFRGAVRRQGYTICARKEAGAVFFRFRVSHHVKTSGRPLSGVWARRAPSVADAAAGTSTGPSTGTGTGTGASMASGRQATGAMAGGGWDGYRFHPLPSPSSYMLCAVCSGVCTSVDDAGTVGFSPLDLCFLDAYNVAGLGSVAVVVHPQVPGTSARQQRQEVPLDAVRFCANGTPGAPCHRPCLDALRRAFQASYPKLKARGFSPGPHGASSVLVVPYPRSYRCMNRWAPSASVCFPHGVRAPRDANAAGVPGGAGGPSPPKSTPMSTKPTPKPTKPTKPKSKPKSKPKPSEPPLPFVVQIKGLPLHPSSKLVSRRGTSLFLLAVLLVCESWCTMLQADVCWRFVTHCPCIPCARLNQSLPLAAEGSPGDGCWLSMQGVH